MEAVALPAAQSPRAFARKGAGSSRADVMPAQAEAVANDIKSEVRPMEP